MRTDLATLTKRLPKIHADRFGSMIAKSWEHVAQVQRDIRDSHIPTEWKLKELPDSSVTNVMKVPYSSGIMTERELQLTEMDATALLELIATGTATSYDVTLAFCKRAAIAQQLVIRYITFNLRLD